MAGTVLYGQTPLPVQSAVYHDVSKTPLRETKAVIPETKGTRRENIVHPLPYLETKGTAKDPVIQDSASADFPIELGGFEGLGYGMHYDAGVAPPDTTGTAGKEYFVEWVNAAFVIVKKDTGKPVYGPAAGNTFWKGFAPVDNPAHACEDTNDGDPMVLYDRMDDRWFVSQFAYSDGPPYLQCIAVSTSADPLGTYARYAYTFKGFNDYGKMGMWPDGYYASFNIFASPARTAPFHGGQACVFERAKMLEGQDARMMCFALAQGGLLPGDMDGKIPPAKGTPNYFLSLGAGNLNYWKFHVDWTNAERSTMDGPDDVAQVPSFVNACNPKTCALVPQPSSKSLLDILGDRLMFRLAYRNFGDHEMLVVNHAVRVPNPKDKNAGVTAFRWYQIVPSSRGLTVHQSGTFRPSEASRWMASMAMDKTGNTAVGYNKSSGSEFPSVYVSGRLAGEGSPGTLAKERLMQGGGASQTGFRWGDYTTMSIDPVDDCSFWFVAEYLKKEDGDKWHTYISHFRVPTCH
jgi:hypothetical protein